MARFSVLGAVVLLIGSHTFATAQSGSEPSGAQGPARQCWDQTANQLRQRTASDASKKTPPVAGESVDSSESGSSEGMAGMTPGTKGSASARAAAESASPSGSARPPGMPDC